MNVIDYIRTKENMLDLFEQTISSKFASFHFDDSSWESDATFIIMDKKEVETIEKALMISVVQHYLRVEKINFEDDLKKDIYNKCTDYLKYYYQNSEFGLINEIKLENYIAKFLNNSEQRVYQDCKWEIQTSMELIKEMAWTKQNTLKAYHLNSEWNDEDYLFETEDYFIRFNWGTSA